MLISAVHLSCICWIYCVMFVSFVFSYCFCLFVHFCCIIKTIHKSFGKLFNITKVRGMRREMFVFAWSRVRLRVCACVRLCVCVCVSDGVMGGNIDFKDIEEDTYSLSITTVQEVVFKAVLVRTFCHICFKLLLFLSEECCSVCKCIIF